MYNHDMKKEASFKNLLEKSLHLALSNMWRNKILSIATIFVVGIIIFIFNIILAVNFIAQDALQDLNKKVDLTIYLQESTSYEQTQQLATEISQLPGVEKIDYQSKDQALEKLKSSHPDLSFAFEKYKLGNPLPASLNITTKEPQYHQEIAELLKQDKYRIFLSDVIQNGDPENNAILSSVSKNLASLTDFTHQLIFWLIMTFVIGGALIILNAIQITIFNRKKEISIMKLVGASNGFIKSPFIIESVIYGVLALTISFIMLVILSTNLSIQDSSLFQYYSTLNFSIIFFCELLVTITISVLSSMIAIHEYMKKDILED